jgi:sugar lactone lactonase YvrE
VDIDSQGNIYVVDTFNHCIRKIDTSGVITTFAGKPNSTWSGDYNPDAPVGDGGLPTKAVLNRPYGIAIDSEDNVYIADTYNNRIRVVWKDPEAHR